MIYINDNYFNDETFAKLQTYCFENQFVIKKIGDKEFCILPTPEDIIPIIQLQNYDLILTFIRKAYKGFDDDMRIHADSIINGRKSDIASVIYINETEGVTLNGTMFWKHKDHGFRMPTNVSNEEFDRMIEEESNNPQNFTRTHYVDAHPNRMLMYESNLFHSKYPKEIKKGERIVMVNFYSKKS